MSETTSFGYLLFPPVWLGGPLVGEADEVRSTGDRIAAAQLPNGLRVSCSRTGLFAFDMTEWPAGAPATTEERGNLELMSERIRARAALINAHLACLHTAEKRVDGHTRTPMVIEPSHILRISDGSASVMDAPEVGALLNAVWSTAAGPPPSDWRFARSQAISRDAVEASYALLADVLEAEILGLVALVQRAAAAFQGGDFDSCLIQAWAVTERLVNTVWERYIAENRQREIDGRVVAFINSDRKDFLTGRDMTISIITEVLSLLDLITWDRYTRLGGVRRARNNWMHGLRPVQAADAAGALALALDFVRDVHQVDLDPSPDVFLMSGV